MARQYQIAPTTDPRLIVKGVNEILHDISNRLAQIEGTATSPVSQATQRITHLDMNGKNVKNIARSKDDNDALSRGEMLEIGLYPANGQITPKYPINTAASGQAQLKEAANTGGAVPATLKNVGGSTGPQTAAQALWLAVQIPGFGKFWIPLWQ